LTYQMTAIAQRLLSGADQVAGAASQISNTSEALSSGATEQAASVQETSASGEELSATIGKNSENAKKSSEITTGSQQSAVKGKQVVEEMIQTIEKINQSNDQIGAQVESSNNEIAEIVKVINEIGNKTKVINEIVFQTKLLSFNASVEAARAGEHGKGFAVVAEEVGNLAQMSGNAAKEIFEMLESSTAKVDSIATNTRSKINPLISSGKTNTEKGTTVAKYCGEALDEIVKNVSSVNLIMQEISSASLEQSNGMKQINLALSQLDAVTQKNASISQQSASAAVELSAQAESLRNAVAELLIRVRGKSDQP
jgi:methyl-accepting chemotaxis protein